MGRRIISDNHCSSASCRGPPAGQGGLRQRGADRYVHSQYPERCANPDPCEREGVHRDGVRPRNPGTNSRGGIMARFLKLTNSYKGPNGCESIAINIDQIVSIVPASMAPSD